MDDPKKRPARSLTPARVIRLEDEQGDNLADSTSAEERIAMVEVLSRRMWEITGRPFPTSDRADMPGRILRPS